MAINTLSEDEYLSCPKCTGRTFQEVYLFSLRKIKKRTGVELKKEDSRKQYLCENCGENITHITKVYEAI